MRNEEGEKVWEDLQADSDPVLGTRRLLVL
jgi:hypothetical protein